MTCATCLDLLKYPVTLECGHSMCKPCILEAGPAAPTRVVCALCRVPSHFANEESMVVNAQLQETVNILRGAADPVVRCHRCDDAAATIDCADCNTKLCRPCSDLVHQGPRYERHVRTTTAASLLASRRAPTCETPGHDEYRLDLYCTDCNVLLCALCAHATATHRAHHVVPLKEAAQVEKVRLTRTLESAGGFRDELRKASTALDAALTEREEASAAELAAFDQMVDKVHEQLEQRRVDLKEEMQRRASQDDAAGRRAKERLVQLAATLNETVATCRRAVSIDSGVDIVTGRVEMERQLAGQQPVVVPSTVVPRFVFPHFRSVLTAVDEIAVVVPDAAKQAPSAVLEASSIFQQRGFRFGKTTYGELQIVSRGTAAVSQRGVWETAMGDALMSTGVHFFEVKLDRYDTANGHNVVVGVVFDGGFELCDTLGEDTNSVGFNCGRGTKCVGGNFLEPYSQPCAQGDVIGVKIDFTAGTLEFFRNGSPLGAAFTGLRRACYGAVSLVNAQHVSLMFPMTVPLSSAELDPPAITAGPAAPEASFTPSMQQAFATPR